MEIEHASISVAGPVRPNNEDRVACWVPSAEADWRDRGAVFVLADGVGGQDRGEGASGIACEATLAAFAHAKPETSPSQLLFQLFTTANLKVYDENMKRKSRAGKMATTLTV